MSILKLFPAVAHSWRRRTLLLAWKPGEPANEFAKRVLRDDILGKAAARTVTDYVRAFTRRFLSPTDTAARHLRCLISDTVPRQVFSDVVFYYMSRQDALLRDFTVLCYWSFVREGRLSISIEDVRQFFWEAERDGRIASLWSAPVKKDMPARVLKTLSDFGLLGELQSRRREILPYRPADATLIYLAYLLHYDSATDSALADQEAWALFGLEPQDVWNRLEVLAGDGWFIIQRAGQVARITWKYNSVEEAVDAIAGR